ncbi:hypothetical protein CAPTEDRAFT_190260 [Capitella teleta]|uniref:Centromere protein Q n=1 Tax=Capitella teleta TaxID=283909 RepID=R7V4D5_CAPTE|nr:hypothetical protein CAPTEDRAFT_190260 [Capitella teleta]|eukprot:ELU13683.1 hypothetical protein CAPTEDRAFT_190260 [Capitella teleta]
MAGAKKAKLATGQKANNSKKKKKKSDKVRRKSSEEKSGGSQWFKLSSAARAKLRPMSKSTINFIMNQLKATSREIEGQSSSVSHHSLAVLFNQIQTSLRSRLENTHTPPTDIKDLALLSAQLTKEEEKLNALIDQTEKVEKETENTEREIEEGSAEIRRMEEENNQSLHQSSLESFYSAFMKH